MIGTAEDAQVLNQMPGDSGMWNLVDSVSFYGFIFYFLFWILSPVCRLPGSTHVSVSLSLSLFFNSLCFVLSF